MEQFMKCFRYVGVLTVLSLMSGPVYGQGVRVRLSPAMIVNESGVGDPSLLVDEQGGEEYPPGDSPVTQWHGDWKKESYPIHAYIELGRKRNIIAIYLYDTNSKGNFVVSVGEPGKWTELFTEKCSLYNTWKAHDVDISTRYVRFTKTSTEANIAEVVIVERGEHKEKSAQRTKELPLADAGAPFGMLPLVDEVLCGSRGDGHLFREEPNGASRFETILNKPARVLPIEGGAKYFAYRLGKGKGLRPGAAYVLAVEYPEDKSRSMFIGNRGAETILGLATGAAVGDVLHGRYVSSNPESLKFPLAGKWKQWKTLFYLHGRYPDINQPRGDGPRPLTSEDGFWVVISQSKVSNHPLSAGAAVSRISLYEVPEPEKFNVKLNPPPKELPRRHLFYREEMSDGAISSQKTGERGVGRDRDWYEYKARMMCFLGMNTFCKDLLEFGHNQGWDATEGGGNDWYWASKTPKRWQSILDMLGKYDLDVLPYYEYCGGVGAQGLGKLKRCLTLGGGKVYTHVSWCENANLDITDEDSLVDVKKLLKATIIRHRDKVNFVGAWFRPRPSQMPISFSNQCLQLFSVEANNKRSVSREDLKSDVKLREKYYQWWFGRRRAFLEEVRDYLRANGCGEAVVLFTADASEAGTSLKNAGIVTDDTKTWTRIAAQAEHKGLKVAGYDEVVRGNKHAEALLSHRDTWDNWEWQHSCPRADPENYRDIEGIIMTYTFNRAYTVSSPEGFDAFRTPSGLAIVRHYFLNESEMEGKVGYFVSDVERAGPYCMLAEARAMANGDPRYIGYLASNCFNRGFPEYVRAFNVAFLALPALPSELLEKACPDPDVVVRSIRTQRYGTYLAVVNVGFESRENVTISLPVKGSVTDAVTGKVLDVSGNKVRLPLYPCQLRSLIIRR